MEALLLLIVGAVASVVIGRGYNVPRDVRRDNTHIRHADEDLATWIQDENKVHLLALNRWSEERSAARCVRGAHADSRIQLQSSKNEILRRYQDQLRSAERLVAGIEDNEQLPHRLWRKVSKNPVPQIETPKRVIGHWVAEWAEPARKSEEKQERWWAEVEETRRRHAKENGDSPPVPLDW